MTETLGRVSLPLVGGSEVDDETIEEAFGLIALTMTTGSGNTSICSGCLIRNDWVVAAAHCVEVKDRNGDPIPEPGQFMQFRTFIPSLVSLNATWRGGQTRMATRIVTFRPYDVALIQVDRPFDTPTLPPGTQRLMNHESLFPYFGTESSMYLTIFGRGIHTFATGAFGMATPSDGDGRFRVGYAKSDRLATSDLGLMLTPHPQDQYWYSSGTGDYVGGGDSGGPSFAWTSSGYALVGVHSLAMVERVLGHTEDEGWDWVSATPEAADAPLRAIRDKLEAVMGSATTQSAPVEVTTGSFGKVTSVDPIIKAFRDRAAVAAERGYSVAYPTFQDERRGVDEYGGTVLVRPEGVEWRNVRRSELRGDDGDDFAAHMRAINSYAQAHGYPGAIPTFVERDFGDGPRVGVFLIRPEAGELRNVDIKELRIDHFDFDDVPERFRASQVYATSQGFGGGFPTMWHEDHTFIEPVSKDEVVWKSTCGTVLLNREVAEWASVLTFRGPS